MPNKNIYIRDEHLALFEQAQKIGGDSISAVIVDALQNYVERESKKLDKIKKEKKMSQLAEKILVQAVEKKASDIHLQPTREGNRVRLRIDGTLQEVDSIPTPHYQGVVNYFRGMILKAEGVEELPRGGMITREIAGHRVDLRVSVVQSLFGPALTARLLLSDAELPLLPRLEPEEEHTEALKKLAHSTHGLVLTTGPTGSGKTTTLYSMLLELDRKKNKVITVEDPVEAVMEDCVQVPLDRREGTSFQPAVQEVMMGDPDILYVAEIRDGETAETLVKSALAGHLVFSVLHAPTAVTALRRLIDVGIAPFMVRDSVAGIVAQRLVRKLCQHCREKDNSPHLAVKKCSLPKDTQFYKPVGCEKCHHTGYRGRTTILEILEPGEKLKEALVTGEDLKKLEKIARKEGMVTMFEDGIDKAARGHTSISEVLRVVGPAD